MKETEIRVNNALGVHARPAAKIVQVANKFTSRISLVKDGAVADAKSIVHVMMLGANFGSEVTVRAEGSDEAAATDAIVTLFAQKFDEE